MREAVVIICFIFAGVATFVVSYLLWFTKKKAALISEKEEVEKLLKQSRIEVQEETYTVLAKELHDNVGQLLSTSKMLLGITERELSSPPETLLSANETLGKAIHELRTLSKSLDADWLEQFSFSENLNAEVSRINTAGVIKAEFRENAAIPITAEKQIILYRIVQEAVQNAVKHAMPKLISILLDKRNDLIEIIVSDDGKGMNEHTEVKGMGIGNMRHRAKAIGGEIKWQSSVTGTEIIITLPLNK